MKEESTAPIDADQGSIHIAPHSQQAEPQVPSKPSYTAAAVQTMPDTLSTATSASQKHTEIQTDIYSCAESEPTPGSVVCETLESPKRDMATSTDEIQTQVILPTSMQSFDMQISTYTNLSDSPKATQTPSPENQKSTQISSAAKHGSVQYLVASEPKPKPSNELTREYIPKVGMTTYTIVPPKTVDKLRFFEVEVTLESPSVPGVQEVNLESLCQKPTETTPPAASPRSVRGFGSAIDHSPSISPTLSSPLESSFIPQAKVKKVPPTTRPKPASFRMPPHKRTPGSYVSSAMVRSLSLSEEKEPLHSPQRESFHELMQEAFLPPQPPVQWEEKNKTREKQHISPPASPLKQKEMERSSPASSPTETEVFSGSACLVLPRQLSLPTAGLSLEKLRSFAAPKPYSSSTPSRFAQAVNSAVKRSQSLTHNPVSPHSHKVPLAMTKRSPIRETDEFVDLPTFRVSMSFVFGFVFSNNINKVEN